MKKILILVLISSHSSVDASRKIQQKYQECKANCQDPEFSNGSCPSCINDCQFTKCRAECYSTESNFKNSQECKDYQNCKINRQDPCDPKPCLDQAHGRKVCFEQCAIISDLAEVGAAEGDTCKSCNECYCFNKFTHEYMGKAECEKDSCTSCENRCNRKFAKYKDKLKAVCN